MYMQVDMTRRFVALRTEAARLQSQAGLAPAEQRRLLSERCVRSP